MVVSHTNAENQNETKPVDEPYLVPADPDRMDEIKSSVESIFPVVYHTDFYTKLFSKDTFMQILCTPADNKIIGLFALRLSTEQTVDLGGANVDCAECLDSGSNDFNLDTVREKKFMYVILLGVVEKFRGGGYGKILLREIDSISVAYGIRHIMLHVQISNLRAIEFYYKSGFKLVKLINNYYNNVYPKDAFLLRKCLYSQ
ncbi:N-alpha-acetyltransferase 50 [Nematocida minor]|uniref:N-alpha-acetyltransferase 50 n=1 Tax=Nematocida minor TaxID=1912983 RepID=UPI0022207C0C|nr:N-alpha-acetyltransferase 50 [Nematocida minor]KAI5192240.1 N-alpha-acetyltransferase 50 [Nematocida minor]